MSSPRSLTFLRKFYLSPEVSLSVFRGGFRLSPEVSLFSRGFRLSSLNNLRFSASPFTKLVSSKNYNAAPTVYEVDKDYWCLKTTIDDIRAKYGLGGGNRIKDPNLDQNSDLELESDLTVADIRRIVKIQQLLEKAAQDLSVLVSASPPEIFSNPDSIKDDDVAVKANVKKTIWLAEDDDVSGNAEEAIKSFKENRVAVAGNVEANAYTLEDGKDENPPVGFRQDLSYPTLRDQNSYDVIVILRVIIGLAFWKISPALVHFSIVPLSVFNIKPY
ncbi:23633_t:CDS:2 [Dentiscutata erythropus]|uniref:23633_t:CDS:1 n=1 Tax=Dentiscutata erythropus TaxID=1348616 RepID=A0A9N9HE29_9GLOM|nr:23633_t:CDS:2 [Dentiscutata erythropus]